MLAIKMFVIDFNFFRYDFSQKGVANEYRQNCFFSSNGISALSTLADANKNRDWRIYADFAQVLIHTARDLYLKDPFGIDLEQTVYAFDATTIDLCLSLFPWAHFRKNKGAIKLHTLLDLRGSIPSFIEITDGKMHEVNILDVLIMEPGSFYVMDVSVR